MSKRAWIAATTGFGVKARGRTVSCYSRQRLALNTKSHSSKHGSVCASRVNICCREGESCYARTLLVSPCVWVCVCGEWVCWTAGSSPTKSFHFHQLQGISHTSSTFFQQQRSTVALAVYFPDFNWARSAITLSQGSDTRGRPNGSSTVKTRLEHSTALCQHANTSGRGLIF